MNSHHEAGRSWLSVKASILLAIVALLTGVLTAPLWWSQASAQVAFGQTASSAPGEPQRHAEGLSEAFRQAAEVATPTVVKITSQAKAKAPRRVRTPEGLPFRDGENPFKGTPFEEFFKNQPFEHGFEDPRSTPQQGTGSGVVIDRSGVILTNNHVVDGADDVYVRFQDGQEVKATKVRRDSRTDLALVWFDPAKFSGRLHAARLGDSDRLKVGDWVLAIGTPFGLEATVSAGIISAKGRNLSKATNTSFLQTDAAINPGNSGGPLVNLDGEVVGINTAIFTETGSFAGIGFAVPSNTAKWVVSELMKNDSVRRAWLGVGISEIDPKLAEQVGVKPHEGVLVTEVRADSPAKKAGLQDGDIILDFAGQRVGTPSELQRAVERSTIGRRHDVRVIRDGKTMTISIDLEALPEKLTTSRVEDDPREGGDEEKTSSSSELGIAVTELTLNAAKRFSYEGHEGVLISRVEADSVAHREGLRPGMLVTRVGNQRVTSVEEFDEATKNVSLKKGVLLQIRTPNGARFVVLKEL
jgi:serine protease Do